MEFLDTVLKIEQLLFPVIGGIFILGVWCNNLKNETKSNKEDIDELKKIIDPSLSKVIKEKFEAVDDRFETMEKNQERLHKDHEGLEKIVGGMSKDLNQLIGLVKGLHPKGEHDND